MNAVDHGELVPSSKRRKTAGSETAPAEIVQEAKMELFVVKRANKPRASRPDGLDHDVSGSNPLISDDWPSDFLPNVSLPPPPVSAHHLKISAQLVHPDTFVSAMN
ncbi:unnamed protein product [Cyclocybe aegerita]|uniref:Uncharacterized protein n=1 Tax=Cyclocybe aegerita TaxID=1973307 RepID=A0A8S0WFY8_CYCAE|nr:unnamed protein product [Cyclocybe aegerita]